MTVGLSIIFEALQSNFLLSASLTPTDILKLIGMWFELAGLVDAT